MMVPPQSPSGICTLIQSDYEGPSPQSPSGICTLIQSDYDGPPTISLRYKCICALIQSEYEGTPTISLVGLHPDKVSGPMVMGFLLITYVVLYFTILFLISVVDYTSRFGRLLA